MNASNVVGGLLADEEINVTTFELAPVGQLMRMEELVKAAREQLDLDERVFGQTFVLSRKAEVALYLR